MALTGHIVDMCRLAEADVEQMYRLMDRYYDGLRQETFLADLSEKQWTIVLRSGRGEICGFSTLMMLQVAVGEDTIHAVYSGDTIVHRDCWGENVLARTWGRLVAELIDRYNGRALYWLLISKGYKTYRYLPVFFHEFYPRFDRSFPPYEKTVLDALAAMKFGGAYDPATGIVSFEGRRDRLRPGIADLEPRRLKDPHVEFFARLNRGHAQGDELACLAPLTHDNFKLSAQRILAKA
jgi:hypothetical protein